MGRKKRRSRSKDLKFKVAIEAWHKTLQYSVGYPSSFTSTDHARKWYADFIHWFNNHQQHSVLGYVAPQ